MAIQGTGTQANPYLVTNCEELRWAVSQTNSYVKLANDIDFNDDSILWLWEPLFFTCAELDGNHKKITNCYCYQKSFLVVNDADTSHIHIFKNTIIEAIYISGNSQSYSINNLSFIQPHLEVTAGSGIGIYFYDCDFRIKFYVEKNDAILFNNYYSANNGYCFLRRCILNIDTFVNSYQKITLFNVANQSSSSTSVILGDVKNCEIKINLHLANSLFTNKQVFNTDTSTSSAPNYLLCIFNLATPPYSSGAINVENNAVFMNIDGINENLPDKLCIMLATRSKIANCYFILNNVMGNYLDTKDIHFKIHDYPGCISSCFMNDKAKFYNKNLKNEDPNMHVLTDTQCKNLQDLLDIGFIVV